ncbi:hypothetical protein [uncultured Bacteroides sp.]|uniref:hypothetical protein n=1 Tax=uncultured Bacteroides sp. TaxID=162156 RepID=UPI0025E67DF7|nr:hypothetical protein [uncultured Bacteroides sp.]
MKKIILFVTIVCVVTIVTCIKKSNTLQHAIAFSLVDIEALANDESTNGENDKKCTTERSEEYMWQECTIYNNTYKTFARKAVKHECKGLGIEHCKKGYLYIYYDCDGYEIGEDDLTYDSYCFL